MKHNKAKIVLSVCLVFILQPFFNSCSGAFTQSASVQTAASNTLTGENETSSDMENFFADVPERDYKGENITVLYPNRVQFQTGYFSEGETGDQINDAAYQRNREVEEQVDIKIKGITKGDFNSIAPAVAEAVLSGDSAYDIALTHTLSGVTTMMQNNYIRDWNNVPYIDLSKPYWNQSLINTVSLYGKLPYISGDYFVPNTCCVLFNKTLLNNYKLGDIYSLVENGGWTWDKLTDMAAAATKDLNGDGQFTNADQFGFIGELDWQFAGILHSCGQCIVAKKSETEAELALNSEKTQRIIDMIYSLLYNKNAAFTYPFGKQYDTATGLDFASGRALFCIYPTKDLSVFRNTDVDFGILPYPKFNEAQENYISLNWSGFMCIPVSVNDTERVGIVSELLSSASRHIFHPTYFNVLLDGKIARDDESERMLDMIFNNLTYDFGANFAETATDGLYIVPKMMTLKSTDLASYYASVSGILETQLKNAERYFTDFKG